MSLMQKLRALFQRKLDCSNSTSSNQTNADGASTPTNNAEPSATHLQTGLGPLCKHVAELGGTVTPRSEELPGRDVDLPVAFDPYRPAPKRSAFEIKLDAARHPRRRRHHKMNFAAPPPERLNSYLESVLYQLSEDSPYSGRDSPCRFYSRKPGYDALDGGTDLLKAGIAVTAAIVADEYVAIRNKITGVGGGVRDWLEQNCPELAHHYHTCQRFKRMVQDDPCQPESEV